MTEMSRFPDPLVDYTIPGWHRDAPCQEVGPELFDPGFKETAHMAAQVCAVCPFADGGLASLCVRDGFDVGDYHLVRAGRSMATWRKVAAGRVAS